MNCLNMENPENPQEWYGVNEHRFCTVLEVKDGKLYGRSLNTTLNCGNVTPNGGR